MTRDNIIFASYGIPLVLLNILTLVSLVSIRKRLSTTFFCIFMLTLGVNLVTYINAWIVLRLPLEQAFNFYYRFANWTGFLPYIQDFLIGLCYFAQNINSALLTVDRYVSIVAIEWKPV
ncbi:hypothetical protein PENTCL1PPCAC_18475 [Pristionchus entomophagus]|uniref:Serpentine receptor class gamma n=1 Tax=Pristionchus entomophagus TaxID=358040 RepID=A0AAV5TPU8_9BILA|nr:hypothetical protein PENTCL1PPCAC_18475 [Pristionchus entomophagus]